MKHLRSVKDAIINGLLAFIPTAIVWGIMNELGLYGGVIGAALKLIVLFGFIYLAGELRIKIGQIKKNSSIHIPTKLNSPIQMPKIEKGKIKKWLPILGIILIVGFAFYWYEYRPTKIRKICAIELQSNQEYSAVKRDNIYKECLARQGVQE